MHINRLEDALYNTFLPVVRGERNGWRIGLSGGYSRRANSVFTHRYHGRDVVQDVAYCEAVYDVHGAITTFRTVNTGAAASLEAILTARGYQPSPDSPVMTVDPDRLATAHPDFTWSATVSDDWLQRYFTLNDVSSEFYTSHRLILQSIDRPCIYGQIGDYAQGLVVLDGEFAVYYDIVVDPESRGRGYGKAIMQSLSSQAMQSGATDGLLCVDGENAIAIGLYHRLGFEQQYGYRYWRK